MSHVPAASAVAPPQLPGWVVERPLAAGRSWLARDAAGRRVVLKLLDPTCLAGGRLAPEIRHRLERIRQLPHPAVANLHGVELWQGQALALWQYVPGQTLEEHLAACGGAPARALAAELVAAVASLHALGLRHGALHARNVILSDTGGLRLTHLSPLLYMDADIDIHGLLELLPAMGCGELADLDCTSPLRTVSQRVLAWSRGAGAGRAAPAPERGWTDRRRSLLAALLLAVAAGALAWSLARRAGPSADPDAGMAGMGVRP